ncbi:MAG: nucleoside kinase [Hyphomicrobiales bacterium]|nr:MAG: nucleoside kinase [Hyphomicrobiales bacterium]
MGRRNFLVEGVSGAGKTSVAEELERRGYDVVHGDRVLAYYGDPETGERVAQPETLSVEAGYERWIWPVERVKALVADQRHKATFFCGGTRNAGKFMKLFDAVFVLEVDLAILQQRVAGRGTDEFGGQPEQWALIARLQASREGLPEAGIRIDSGRPVGMVVDEIVARCGLG